MTESTTLPRHIAIIMDGNGRWATRRGLSRLEGHRAGAEATRRVVKYLGERRIEYLTLYAFSSENWTRPPDEIKGLFSILAQSIKEDSLKLHRNNVRIVHLGRMEGLPDNLKQSISQAITLTQDNGGMTIALAFNYGGRQEIVDSLRHIVQEAIPLRSINEDLVGKYLYTQNMPDVDLMVRTGGELRISNFLLWQSAYAEYYFTRILWPDMTEKELDRALETFSKRQRRFGGL